MRRVRFEHAVEQGVLTGWEYPAVHATDQAVVLVHGVNGYADEWDVFARVVGGRHRIIAVDLPGHGESRVDAPFDLAACVGLVERLLRERGVEHAHLVGSSFGGGVVIALAAEHPDLVSTLTTLGTGPGGEHELFAAISARIRAHGAPAFYAETIPRYSYPPETPPHVIEQAVSRASAQDADTALAILEAAFCTELSPYARRVTVPRMILGGEEDRTCTPKHVTELADACASAAHIVPGFGHLPHIEQPERLAGLLEAYWAAPVEPRRTVRDLDELDGLTRDGAGVQRLCWTPVWASARRRLKELLAEVPGVQVEQDAAGNLHATLPGRSPNTLVIGSHFDSVPDGGNLDGAYGVLAGLEVLRAFASRPVPPAVTIRLTDWADEEGARFGRSLFGSSVVAGSLDLEAFSLLTDREGRRPADVLAEHGVHLRELDHARAWLRDVHAYLELHIEQGPRLEHQGLPLAAVTGSLGVERHRVVLHGAPCHAGGTPMELRADPVAAAASFLVRAREAARAAGGLLTCGVVEASPGTPTAVAESVSLTLDVRHEDGAVLASLWNQVLRALDESCGQEGVHSQVDRLWTTPPVPFDPELIDTAARVVELATGHAPRLVSGPLHDACEMAGAGIPTAMLFVPSSAGISHAPVEYTPPERLQDGIRALAALAVETIARIESS
ncbi:hydantoinase/carbamoylase family amidase [Rhizohabitans arisaemae]|uniref:hydantoinase/carbamoylase family amidase n=1 Tax=Rhizohabitans arisaemae TaxID=2720610 RepID=UPI0024B1AB29|nr:hydantoinase/carbamoylase family amidase [Rhizohabitans arisaemae]